MTPLALPFQRSLLGGAGASSIPLHHPFPFPFPIAIGLGKKNLRLSSSLSGPGLNPSASAMAANEVQKEKKEEEEEGGGGGAPAAANLAQYVVIRKDLVEVLKWPLGSVLAQACHAAVAAVWLHKDHPHTSLYCHHLDSMTTVTLEVKGETQLINLAQKLQDGGIAHKLWIEQPENFPTCLATKPYPKDEVAHYFKKLKLCK